MTAPYVLSGISQANASRNRLGLALTEPIGDIFRLVSEGSFVLFFQPAGPDGPDGMYAERHGFQFGWINSSKPHVRQRFTIAHEYAHCIFRDPGLVVDEDVLAAATVPEKRANVFAAEFLAPQPAIVAWFDRHSIDPGQLDLNTLVRLGVYLGVSAETVLYRLINIGLLSTKKKADLKRSIAAGEHYKESAYIGYRDWADTGRSLGAREPHLPLEMRETAWKIFRAGLVDETRLASLLRRTPSSIAADIQELGITLEGDDEEDAGLQFDLPQRQPS